jgi:hypothetical protein
MPLRDRLTPSDRKKDVRKPLLLLVLLALVLVPAAGADVGITLTTVVVHRCGWIRGVGDGSGLPVYLVPKRFAPRREGTSEPRSKRPPRRPFILLGRLRKTRDPYADQRFRFRVPRVRPGRYRVFLYCGPCGGSLIVSGNSFEGQTLRIVR